MPPNQRAALTTDMVTILAEIAATPPIVMGVCNEPVCHYCGLTQFRALPPALLDAMR